MVERSESLPLAGINVLVTRALEQSSGLVDDLTSKGAQVTVIPAVSIVALPESEGLSESLAEALAKANTYDNIVFTSVNGVAFTLEWLSKKGMGPRDLPSALCVGEKTARAWEEAGGTVGTVPEQYTAEALLKTLGDDLTGCNFLIMRPEVIKTELGQAMRSRGAWVDEIVIYRTVSPVRGGEVLDELLSGEGPDVVFFASPSAVAGMVEMTARSRQDAPRPGSGQPERRITDIPAVCIGPTTAKAAEEAGFTEIYFPDEHTAEGMVNELLVIAGGLK